MRSRIRNLVPVILGCIATACGHGLAPVGPDTTGLTGEVTLAGTWPADTGVVAVALFTTEPVSNESELPVIFTEAPAFGASSFTYTWIVQPGEYGYLVVAWMRAGDNLLDISSWVEIGCHSDPANPGEPGRILITPGVQRRLDLTADFSLVPPPSGKVVEHRGRR